MRNTKILPFRSYKEEDVINIFSLNPNYASRSTDLHAQTEVRNDGAAGTFVKIENGNFNQSPVDFQNSKFLGKNNQNGFNYDVNGNKISTTNPQPFVGSDTHPVNPLTLMPTDGYDMPLGITLNTTAIGDENGERLLYNKTKKEELQAILPGQTVPVATKGIFTFHAESFDGVVTAQGQTQTTKYVRTDGVQDEFLINTSSPAADLYPTLTTNGSKFVVVNLKAKVLVLAAAGTLLRTTRGNTTQTLDNEWEEHTFTWTDDGMPWILGTNDGSNYSEAGWRNLRVYDADTGNLLLLHMLADSTDPAGTSLDGVLITSNSPSETTPVGFTTSVNSYYTNCEIASFDQAGFGQTAPFYGGVGVLNSGIKTSSTYGGVFDYSALPYLVDGNQLWSRELGKIAVCDREDPFCFGTIIGTGQMDTAKTDGLYSNAFWANTLPPFARDKEKTNYYIIKIGK